MYFVFFISILFRYVFLKTIRSCYLVFELIQRVTNKNNNINQVCFGSKLLEYSNIKIEFKKTNLIFTKANDKNENILKNLHKILLPKCFENFKLKIQIYLSITNIIYNIGIVFVCYLTCA